MQRNERSATFAGFAHYALVNKPEACVKVASTRIVFVDIEVHAMGAELVKDDAHQLVHDPAAEALPRCSDHEAFQLDGPGGLLDAAEQREGLDGALFRFAHEVACLGAGKCLQVTLRRPLPDEVSELRNALQRGDLRYVGR